MLLVSYEFLAFFAAALILYYLVPSRFRWVFLLASSYLFYVSGGAAYLLYPLLTAASTWYLALRIGRLNAETREFIRVRKPEREEKKAYQARMRKRGKRFLLAGLALNFGILAVLKYTNFLLDNLNAVLFAGGAGKGFAHVNWILPLGISYYTFQSMGYLLDVYHGKYEPERNFWKFSLFVSYFPQIVSGPISRFDELKKELFAEHRFDGGQVTFGLWRILWGFFKKLVIADRLAPAVDMLCGSPDVYNGIYVLIAMLGYTLRLYADFSGCMDIVIGVSQCFGIRLPENFDRPFSAKSLAELWRRWHMTLTRWFRDYLFFPVSASRFSKACVRLAEKIAGKNFAVKIPVYVANLCVWLVTGIWHGASWKFVAWGLANGAVLILSQELTDRYRAFHKRFPAAEGRAYGCFQKIRTCLLFAVLLMFQYYPFGTVFSMLADLLLRGRPSQLFDGRFAALGLLPADLIVLGAGMLLMLLVSVLENSGSVRQKLAKCPLAVRYGLVFALFAAVLVTGSYGHGYDAGQFIYNQF